MRWERIILCADKVIWERKLMHVDLPGEMSLRKPIRLVGPRAAGE